MVLGFCERSAFVEIERTSHTIIMYTRNIQVELLTLLSYIICGMLSTDDSLTMPISKILKEVIFNEQA